MQTPEKARPVHPIVQTTSQRLNVVSMKEAPKYKLLIDGPKADFSSCCRRGSITMRKRMAWGQNRPPLITGNSPDLCPFNLTQPLRPQYQSFSNLHNFPLIPMPHNRCKRIGYSIKSNAFSRSYTLYLVATMYVPCYGFLCCKDCLCTRDPPLVC